MLHRRAFIIAAATLALAGCGSAAKVATVPVSRPTRLQYISESDAICQAALPQRRALGTRIQALLTKANDEAQLISLTREAESIIAAENAKLEALPRPEGQTQAIGEMYNMASEGLTESIAAIDAFAKHQNNAAKADSAVAARSTAVALGLAQLFGFRVCGQRGKHEVWIPG